MCCASYAQITANSCITLCIKLTVNSNILTLDIAGCRYIAIIVNAKCTISTFNFAINTINSCFCFSVIITASIETIGIISTRGGTDDDFSVSANFYLFCLITFIKINSVRLKFQVIINAYYISNFTLVKRYAANLRAISNFDFSFTVNHAVKIYYAFTSQCCLRRSAISKFFFKNYAFCSYCAVSQPYAASMSNTIYISSIIRRNLIIFLEFDFLRVILQSIYGLIIFYLVS